MIPLQITLRNFLSYREATLDFRGLQTACICGSNGSGKSSLLEAIAWAIWGESRATMEDDVVHVGEREAQVDFIFQSHHHLYRVIRTRQRGQATALEFQVGIVDPDSDSPPQFRPLTQRGMRATQQVISQHLKLDYETFVNSAYLRQGRADEFMLKRPSERKQILADLLKLDQYDLLAEQARDQSRQFKAQVEVLERNLQAIQFQLRQREAIAQETRDLEAELARMQQAQAEESDRLVLLQTAQQQRRMWEQQLTWQQQQQQTLNQDCQRLQQELTVAQHQRQSLASLIQQQEAIAEGYAHWQALQTDEEAQVARFQAYQTAQEQRQHLQQQQEQHLQALKTQLWQTQTQMEALSQQEQEIQKVLGKAVDIEAALEQLRIARHHLYELDQLQAQVAPLLQRRQQLLMQRDRAQARLSARLEELQSTAEQLEKQQERQPQIRQAVLDMAVQIDYLEQRRLYQQQVREQGTERRSFMERLQERQREYEVQLANLEQKIQFLKQPDAACPLCDRPLDEHHWDLVLQKHQTEQADILDQVWVLREQLAVSDREIQVLRQEYRDLERELARYPQTLQQRGQLQEQLHMSADSQARLRQLLAEQDQVTQQLQTGSFAQDLQTELQALEQHLQNLWGDQPYDERTHALARGDVDRWRWAEIKQAELKQAQRRQTQIAQRRPELQAQLDSLDQQIAALYAAESPLQQQIEQCDRYLAELNYDREHHQEIRTALRQAQPWQLRYQELLQAQQQYPQVQQRCSDLEQLLQGRTQELQQVAAQMTEVIQQLEHLPDAQAAIQTLEQQIAQRRSHLDQQLAHLGRLQQQQQQLAALSSQHEMLVAQLQTDRKQQRIYEELAQAFGKNGIQALMIENVLPQLEAETNHILAKLSANQLHIQFVTQRSSRSSSSRASRSKDQPKLIDTLDILIADARGTRPYETYSGGEAFRVNFAIRLALARLLAQRSGTALQMLIVDEGFGSQDAEGCDRLVAAINAIASDFACILMVTHIPHFKEAFQARIEVSKTDLGSQLSLAI